MGNQSPFSVIIVSGPFQNGVPMVRQNAAHVVSLTHAEFQAQIPALFQGFRVMLPDGAVKIQPVVTAVEGQRRFKILDAVGEAPPFPPW